MKALDMDSGFAHRLRALGVVLARVGFVALCATAPLLAQERPSVEKPGDDSGPVKGKPQDIESLHPMSSDQELLIQLFGKVETQLREIDRLLSDAGAGDTRALDAVGPAGIDELLKHSKASGEEVVQNIDKILEIAKRQGQSSSSSSGGGEGQQPQQQQGGGQSGSSPLDGQSGNTTQRESTPSAPEQGGQKPEDKPGGSKQDGEKGESSSKKDGDKQKGEGAPKDPTASKSDPRNRESGPPPGGARDSASASPDGRDRWGDLPVHARDVFRNEGGRDMPVQYRDWIDSYYKRLNKKVP